MTSMSADVFLSDTEKTFGNQSELPSLPVHPLRQTLDRYLDSVRPVSTDEEYRKTERLVNQFESGIGKELHKKLCEKAKHSRNWLAKWWDEAVYLELRNSNALFGNMSGPGPYMYDVWPAKLGTQLERAALLIYYVAEYWNNLRLEKLAPHRDRKGKPLCMNQFRRMFNTTRIPGLVKDQLSYNFKTADEGDCPTDVIVMCKGRIFSIPALDDEGNLFTAPEFERQLEIIQNTCSNLPHGQGLSNLTTLERAEWAKVRGRILSLHPDNFLKLNVIERSTFVVGLDYGEPPKDESELSWKGLGGDAETKWFDKSLCLTVFKNGLVASNCDHAPTDAMVLVSCTYYVHLRALECQGYWQGSKAIRKLPQPIQLELYFDSVVTKAITDAKTNFKTRCNMVEISNSHFTDYGKKRIRKYKFHPDAHVQLALQLAYYRRYKKPAPTYETATIRNYYHARTETMRSCTVEAINWCKAMIDPSVSDSRRFQLYKLAADKHNYMMEQCSQLKGCDRHLLGLAMICREENIPFPEIFSDPSFFKSGGGGNYVLSTSSVGYSSVYGGVAPMCTNGYGTFYRMPDTEIVFFISSWVADEETSVKMFEKDLFTSLREMMEIIETQMTTSARL